MKPFFKICKNGACGVTVIGLEQEDHQYSSVLIDDYGVFRYTDTVSINVITPVDHKENEGDSYFEVKPHLEEDIMDSVDMQFKNDGLHKITHLILPTVQWYHDFIAEGFDPSILYDYIYLYDDGIIYKVVGDKMEEVSVLEPININQNMCCTAFYDYQYTFCTCRLQECFYKYAKNYLSSICTDKCAKDEVETRNRDIIWMAINVIQYLLDLGRYFEAQKILEDINKCTGLCHNNSFLSERINCGCNN